MEGARTQAKAVESALEQARKEAASQTMTEEAEAEDEEEDSIEDEEEDGLQPAGCKRWCTKVRVGFPIDLAYVKKQTDAKCQSEQCKDCAGGGLTIPDCREKEVAVESTPPKAENFCSDMCRPLGGNCNYFPPLGDNSLSDKEGEKKCKECGSKCAEDVPQCHENPAEPVKACRLKEGETELTCTHVSTPWCMPPSTNPGHKYRAGASPLCCEMEQSVSDCDMADVKEEVKIVEEKLENEKLKEDDPPAPVPVCAVGHTFEVDSFKRKGKTVHVCRDKDTGRFAKKVCCDADAFKLLEDEEKAEEVCATVASKYCKPSIGAFEKKRKKYKDMPSTFSCKRMYMCCERGEECFGPVPNQSWCMKEKTGLDKNRPATKKCVAVKK